MKNVYDALRYAKETMQALAAGKPVRDLDEQLSWIDFLLLDGTGYGTTAGSHGYVSRRILDEREVTKLAREQGLPRYMFDTPEGRMALAKFAHAAQSAD